MTEGLPGDEIPNFLAYKNNGSTVTPTFVSIKGIIAITAAHFGISVADMLSERRGHDVLKPRHTAMYLAKKLTKYSLPAIARRFHRSDHSTIVHAVKNVQKWMAGQDGETFAADVAEIERRVVFGEIG